MKKLWQYIYAFLIMPALVLLFFISSLFSARIRKGFYPRFSTIKRLHDWLKKEHPQTAIILFHAASYGEFEHIRPVLQILKKSFKTTNIVTFFSPSGFINVKEAEGLDFHLYMPIDKAENWRKIYSLLQPVMVIVAKWDVWPAQVWTAKAMNIPIYLINASLRENSTRILPGIKQFLNWVFCDYTSVFAVSDEDGKRLAQHFPCAPIEIVGDTKYDQAVLRKERALLQDLLPPEWLSGYSIFLAGSIWPEDEVHLLPALQTLLGQLDNLRIVLVPHKPDQKSIENLQRNFTAWGVKKFSSMSGLSAERVIVVDKVGVLAGLYHHAQAAYVGGSFRQGIHNVMEPAVFALPVLFGPVHENSFEAVQLARDNGGIVVKNEKMIYNTIKSLFADESQRILLGKKAESYALRNTGATKRLIEYWRPIISAGARHR
jgi:3-deoxy-D-manno-octulosonic-acid transferase